MKLSKESKISKYEKTVDYSLGRRLTGNGLMLRMGKGVSIMPKQERLIKREKL